MSGKKLGPERLYLRGSRGKYVVFQLADETILEGKILWVDRYTLGIKLSTGDDEVQEGTEICLFKHAIAYIYAR